MANNDKSYNVTKIFLHWKSRKGQVHPQMATIHCVVRLSMKELALSGSTYILVLLVLLPRILQLPLRSNKELGYGLQTKHTIKATITKGLLQISDLLIIGNIYISSL